MVDSKIFQELADTAKEFNYSDEKWHALDEVNTINDYVTYIGMYATDAAKVETMNDPDAQYAMMIKAANLALTAAFKIRTGTMTPRPIDLPEGGELIAPNHEHGAGRAFNAA